jgi:hypothetical protein
LSDGGVSGPLAGKIDFLGIRTHQKSTRIVEETQKVFLFFTKKVKREVEESVLRPKEEILQELRALL